MFKRIFKTIHSRADELLVAAVVLIGAALYYAPSLMPHLAGAGFSPIGADSTLVKDTIESELTEDKAAVIALIKSDTLTVDSLEFKAAALDIERQITSNPNVTSVRSYASTDQEALVSKDRHGTLALVSIKGDETAQEHAAAQIRENVKSTTLTVSYAGNAMLRHDITQQINKDLAFAETLSFAVLAVLLVFVFRGFIAALLPLLLGGFTILVALLVLRVLVEFTTIVEYALNVIILIGLGLAIDYSLLMVSRFREELVAQKGEVAKALQVTMHTAGRTIFFSGLTVIISLLSLVVFPLDFLRSMGLGGAAAVLVAMGGALVVLPALLRLIGRRINWLSFGRAKQMDAAAQTGDRLADKKSFWVKTGQLFMRSPALVAVVTLLTLGAGGLPFLSAQLATPDHTVLPQSSLSRQATQELRNDYAVSDSPVQILYIAQHDLSTETAPLYAYTEKVKAVTGVKNVQITAPPKDNKLLIEATLDPPTMSAQAQTTVKNIRTLTADKAQVAVGGATAELVDLLAMLTEYIPIALAIIAITLLILLFFMLGSVVLPVVAMLQNTLSLAVSFGALVLVFQQGFLADLLPFNVTGAIDATQPVLIFAVAFGLSMDYSVFLYGRIKEEYDSSGDTNKAVLAGLQKTGGIITSAAVLLLVVVAAFAMSGISIMQQVGVGLALAILVDAFIVRMVLVPATMKLLGKVNWWAPRWLVRVYRRAGLSE